MVDRVTGVACRAQVLCGTSFASCTLPSNARGLYRGCCSRTSKRCLIASLASCLRCTTLLVPLRRLATAAGPNASCAARRSECPTGGSEYLSWRRGTATHAMSSSPRFLPFVPSACLHVVHFVQAFRACVHQQPLLCSWQRHLSHKYKALGERWARKGPVGCRGR